MPDKTSASEPAGGWYVYVILASDESLYTGITTDVERRFKEHGGSTKGARFFRGRTPVAVVYKERHADRSSASQREAQIKKLSRKNKLDLIGLKFQTWSFENCPGAHVDERLSVSRS